MSTPIELNTADLQDILNAVNNLPDAGGGGTVVDPVIQSLEVTENGTYTAPNGVDGYSPVVVDVPIPDGYIVPAGTKEITENGTHDVTQVASVEVNVPTGGTSEDLNEVLEEQEALIAELQDALRDKAAGGNMETLTIVNNTKEFIVFNGYVLEQVTTEIPYPKDVFLYSVLATTDVPISGYYVADGEEWCIGFSQFNSWMASFPEANALPGTVITFNYVD